MPEQETINGVSTAGLTKTVETVAANPELAKCQFRARNQWLDGGNNRVRLQQFHAAGQEFGRENRRFELTADEPPVLLGQDRGANPVEYLLTALSSCMTTSMVYHAAAHGYHIEELESEFEGDLDLQGFLGLSDKVRPGYQQIRATFHVKSDAPPGELAKYIRFSPVYDVVSKSVPVEVRVEERSMASAAG